MIRVEFSARQAVEGAEVQATREDPVRTATLSATKKRANVRFHLIPFPILSIPRFSDTHPIFYSIIPNEIRRKFSIADNSLLLDETRRKKTRSLSNNNLNFLDNTFRVIIIREFWQEK